MTRSRVRNPFDYAHAGTGGKRPTKTNNPRRTRVGFLGFRLRGFAWFCFCSRVGFGRLFAIARYSSTLIKIKNEAAGT